MDCTGNSKPQDRPGCALHNTGYRDPFGALTKPAQSVNWVSREGGRVEKRKKKKNKMDKIITGLQPLLRLRQLYVSPACLYIILGASKNHGQLLDQRQSHQAK
jgi:hypothetical protein